MFKFKSEQTERHVWPKGVIHAVAETIKQRHHNFHSRNVVDRKRQALLQTIHDNEEAFVDFACKTFI